MLSQLSLFASKPPLNSFKDIEFVIVPKGESADRISLTAKNYNADEIVLFVTSQIDKYDSRVECKIKEGRCFLLTKKNKNGKRRYHKSDWWKKLKNKLLSLSSSNNAKPEEDTFKSIEFHCPHAISKEKTNSIELTAEDKSLGEIQTFISSLILKANLNLKCIIKNNKCFLETTSKSLNKDAPSYLYQEWRAKIRELKKVTGTEEAFLEMSQLAFIFNQRNLLLADIDAQMPDSNAEKKKLTWEALKFQFDKREKVSLLIVTAAGFSYKEIQDFFVGIDFSSLKVRYAIDTESNQCNLIVKEIDEKTEKEKKYAASWWYQQIGELKQKYNESRISVTKEKEAIFNIGFSDIKFACPSQLSDESRKSIKLTSKRHSAKEIQKFITPLIGQAKLPSLECKVDKQECFLEYYIACKYKTWNKKIVALKNASIQLGENYYNKEENILNNINSHSKPIFQKFFMHSVEIGKDIDKYFSQAETTDISTREIDSFTCIKFDYPHSQQSADKVKLISASSTDYLLTEIYSFVTRYIEDKNLGLNCQIIEGNCYLVTDREVDGKNPSFPFGWWQEQYNQIISLISREPVVPNPLRQPGKAQ